MTPKIVDVYVISLYVKEIETIKSDFLTSVLDSYPILVILRAGAEIISKYFNRVKVGIIKIRELIFFEFQNWLREYCCELRKLYNL